LETELLNFEIIDLAPRTAEMPHLEGENARDILLLYEQSNEPGVKAFLERVLQAAQVNLAKDTHFANLAQDSAPSFSLLRRTVSFQTLLVFGFSPADLGLQINWNHYLPLSFMDKTLLFCHPLHVLMEERAQGSSTYSGPFWKALQQIFLLK